MSDVVQLPGDAGSIDLRDFAFEAGLIRLATVGAAGYPLDFSAPATREAIAAALTDDPFTPFSRDVLAAHAGAALDTLDAAVPEHADLTRLVSLWRPRLLALAGRQDELTGEEAVVLRFEERLRDLRRAMAEADAAGDEDRREALHAKYIEIGTSYAGRLAARER